MFRLLKRLVVLALVLLCLAAVAVYPMARKSYSGIYKETLRFHVLADSDEEEAQELKLYVRDGVLAWLSPKLEDCTDREEAERTISALLPEIEAEAVRVAGEKGCDLPIKAVFGKEFYPSREYENLSYPAGEYQSLRIFIGSGEGRNWWCVLYPPLCLSASAASSGQELENYSVDERAILKKEDNGYKVRFFLLEWGARILHFFQ